MDFHHDLQTEKAIFEPRIITCPTASTRATQQPAIPQEKEKATNPLGHALDTSKTRKGMLQHTPTFQDTRILSGYHLPFLTSSKNTYTTASNLQDILKFKIIQIVGETKKCLKGLKVKRLNPKIKILSPNVRSSIWAF